MILFLIYILLIIAGLVFKKNKFVSIVMLVFMWILFGWSYGNADYSIYLVRYNYYSNNWVSSITEPIFTILMKLFNGLGFNYQQFLIILSIIGLLIYYIFAKSQTENVNVALSFYMIFPLCMDICQIRFYIASIFVYIGFYFLFNEKISQRKSMALYILFATIATMCHFGAIFTLLFVLAKKYSKQKCEFIVVGLIAIIFLFEFAGFNRLSDLPNFSSSFFNKIIYVIRNAEKYNIREIIKAYFRMIIFFFCFFLEYLILIKSNINKEKFNKLNLAFKINILALIIFPLIFVSLDLYRIQFLLTFANYVTFTSFIVPVKIGHINKKNVLINSSLLIYSIVLLFILVLSNQNIVTVFWTIFSQNKFF